VDAPLDAQRVLFHLDDRRIHVLNASAAAIWETIAEPDAPEATAGIEAITGRVATAFGVAAPDIAADVEATIGRFAVDGLLATGPGDAPRGGSGPAGEGNEFGSPAIVVHVAGRRVQVHCDTPEITVVLDDVLRPLRRSGGQANEHNDVHLLVERADGGWRVRIEGLTTPGAQRVDTTRPSPLRTVQHALAAINEIAVATNSVPSNS